jgi:DNA-binding NarL/FixJ family response regulator
MDRRNEWPFVPENSEPTQHELAVFEAFVEEDTVAQAAYRLGLSPRTVKRVTAAVRVRLGTATSLQALREAMRRGLIH